MLLAKKFGASIRINRNNSEKLLTGESQSHFNKEDNSFVMERNDGTFKVAEKYLFSDKFGCYMILE